MTLKDDILHTLDTLAARGVELPADLAVWRKSAETFADLRGKGKPGGRTKEVTAVNDYQKALEEAYAKWARETARDLANAKPEDRDAILEAALLALLAILIALGHEYLPDAVDLGLDGTSPFADIYGELEDAMDENDAYLRDSLIPALRDKMQQGLSDEDILLALGTGAGAVALYGLLEGVTSRVAMYAGAFWGLLNKIRGMAADETGQAVTWNLDPRAHHCPDCLQWGDHTYTSYEAMLQETGGISPTDGTQCGDNDRCWISFGE